MPRVFITKEENKKLLGLSKDTVIYMPMEEYLMGIVPSEMPSFADEAAFEAQSICARTYAAGKEFERAEWIYDVKDTTADQAYNVKKIKDLQAIRNTAGLVLYYYGALVDGCKYTASNNGISLSGLEAWNHNSDRPYLRHFADDNDVQARKKWYDGKQFEKPGHRVGLSQVGACYLASIGKDYKYILNYYFRGTEIVNMDIKKCIFTENKCYSEPETMIPIGIMVHDTGAGNPYLKRYLTPNDGIIGDNQYHNHWNTYLEDNNKCVHAFIGKGVDEKVYTYQTLDWTLKAHHSGQHRVTHKRAWDMGYIGFEICDDKYVHEDYFKEAYEHAIKLCVYLCKRYDLKSSDIISHAEGHELGIASNHGDPHKWFSKFGKSMDSFRYEVAERLGESMAFQNIEYGHPDKVLVKKIQKRLIKLGFGEYLGTSGPDKDGADGDYKRKTRRAITALQEKAGIVFNPINYGVVNEATYYFMFPEEEKQAEPVEPADPCGEELPEAVDYEWLKEKIAASRVILDEIEAVFNL